jgi:hypothetical protein
MTTYKHSRSVYPKFLVYPSRSTHLIPPPRHRRRIARAKPLLPRPRHPTQYPHNSCVIRPVSLRIRFENAGSVRHRVLYAAEIPRALENGERFEKFAVVDGSSEDGEGEGEDEEREDVEMHVRGDREVEKTVRRSKGKMRCNCRRVTSPTAATMARRVGTPYQNLTAAHARTNAPIPANAHSSSRNTNRS